VTASSKNDPLRMDSAGSSPSAIEGRALEVAAAELAWLLEIGPLLLERRPWASAEARNGRLSRVLTGAVKTLGCELAAITLPARSIRLVERSPRNTRARAERVLAALESPVLKRLRRDSEITLVNRARTGRSLPLRLLAVPVSIGGDQSSGALLLVRSVGAPGFTRGHAALARHLSHLIASSLDCDRDCATGLHTRASLQTHLQNWRSAERAASSPHSIISMKVGRLDAVNKMSGFDAGDAVIAAVAGLLRPPHLTSDALAARISGGEFAIILPLTAPDHAQHTAQGLQRFSATLLGGAAAGQEPISLSFGIASFGSSEDFETGLALAQLACRTARARGAGRIETYHDTDVSMIQRHTDIIAVHQLREALRDDRLTLYAQRILPLRKTSENGGYELLLRSADDLAENRAPLRLLSAAHRNHLAPAVDLWVIEHALTEAVPYRTELKEAKISLSINITGPSLTDQKLLERIRKLIEASCIDPGLITFEITETVAVLSLAKAVAFIRELRELGCRFALDDFGTGVNSLKNLTSLPVDRVKIDGSFVADLLTNRQSESMVRAIVSLARDFGISTVAEYAGSAETIDRLRDLGVQYAQGYGIDRPRPFADVLGELRARMAHPGRSSNPG
jgi:diguanylate cyclase (GGDEF)-like protein